MSCRVQNEEHPTLDTRKTLKEPRATLRVLVVEDNLIKQTLLARMLEKWGHRPMVRGNEQRGLGIA
jgi:PleD family two-component response regulator